MIVTSMSRKAPTFSQLAGYIGQDGDGGAGRCFSQNLYYDGDNQKTVSGLFWDNYRKLPERKNGNALYHEIIVIEPQPHLTRQRQMQILRDLAREYSQARAPYQLVWGRMHFDTNYPHIHLMISANEIGSARRKRLDKAAYNRIQKELETYKEVTWPELVEQRVYNKAHKSNVKIKASEGEYVRRTGKPSDKMNVAEMLNKLFTHHTHIDALKSDLARAKLVLYQRGSTWGIENTKTGKRYRLKTLGLIEDFSRILDGSQRRPQSEDKPRKANLNEREQALLKSREDMRRHARRQLKEFERGDDEGLDR